MKVLHLLAVASLLAAGCATAPRVLPHDPAPPVAGDPRACPVIMALGPLQAIYPHQALETGQEGWTRLRFDVGTDGAAANIRVTGSSPPGFFDEAALNTIRKIEFRNYGNTGCEFVFEYRK